MRLDELLTGFEIKEKEKSTEIPCESGIREFQFRLQKVYGEIGRGFIECHHKKPLYALIEETETTLGDLMLVCSKCHRMLHRGREINSVS